MSKKTFLAVLFFSLVMLPVACAAATNGSTPDDPVGKSFYAFAVDEGEEFHIQINASDPDGDNLRIRFDPPLLEDGSWLTTYEDAGEYESTAYIGDGKETVELPLVLTVSNVNRPIKDVLLGSSAQSVEETQTVFFTLSFSDADKEEVSVDWSVNGVAAKSKVIKPAQGTIYEDGFTVTTDYGQRGNHTIEVVVADEETQERMTRSYSISKKNRLPTLVSWSQITTVNEGEEFSLELQVEDADGDHVTITYPDSFSDAGVWKTTFTDAGSYVLPVLLSDGDSERKVEFNLTVNNVNRAPVLDAIPALDIPEGKELAFEVRFSDEDKDDLKSGVIGAPEGTIYNDGELRYTPSFDVVSAQLGVTIFNLTFFVDDGVQRVEQISMLSVHHTNRPPAFDSYGQWGNEVSVREGERLVLSPRYADPDDDVVTITYAGWMDSAEKDMDYEDQGTYSVVITASDGEFAVTQTLTIKVVNVNDPPALYAVPVLHVREGDTLRYRFGFSDTDPVHFNLGGFPAQVLMEGDTLLWTPLDGIVNGTDSRGTMERLRDIFIFWRPTGVHTEFTGTVHVTDVLGLKSAQNVTIRVYDGDAPPSLVTSTPNTDHLVVFKYDIVSFHVEARDSSPLAYTWKFGLFDSAAGTETHRRKFTELGVHPVRVEVSDGEYTVEKEWEVEVVEFTPYKVPEPIVEKNTSVVETPKPQEKPKEPEKPAEPQVFVLPVE